jgi:hypothetical protein
MMLLNVKPLPLHLTSLLGTNIHLRILFSITLSLHSSLNVGDQFHNHIAQLAILLFSIFEFSNS